MALLSTTIPMQILYAAPIYANFRANFINKKVTPFADVKAGYAVGDIEGAYASIGVGVRFSLKGKKALNLALMYNFQDYDDHNRL